MVYESRYLAHHGIKGQRWGVRRYQNTDGTLTEAGKKRRAKELVRTSRNNHKETSGLDEKTEMLRAHQQAAKELLGEHSEFRKAYDELAEHAKLSDAYYYDNNKSAYAFYNALYDEYYMKDGKNLDYTSIDSNAEEYDVGHLTNNSVGLYLTDKGISPSEYLKKYDELSSKLYQETKKVVDYELGKLGDKDIKAAPWLSSVKAKVLVSENLDEMLEFMVGGVLPNKHLSDEDYKRTLDIGKKLFPEYVKWRDEYLEKRSVLARKEFKEFERRSR